MIEPPQAWFYATIGKMVLLRVVWVIGFFNDCCWLCVTGDWLTRNQGCLYLLMRQG